MNNSFLEGHKIRAGAHVKQHRCGTDLVVGEAPVEQSAEVVWLLFQGLAVVQDGAMVVPPLAQHVPPGMMLLHPSPFRLLQTGMPVMLFLVL